VAREDRQVDVGAQRRGRGQAEGNQGARRPSGGGEGQAAIRDLRAAGSLFAAARVGARSSRGGQQANAARLITVSTAISCSTSSEIVDMRRPRVTELTVF